MRCSSPVRLWTSIFALAVSTSRSFLILMPTPSESSLRRPHVWQDLLAEQADLLVAVLAPQLEHHVSAPCVAVLLDRPDAIGGRAPAPLSPFGELVGRHPPRPR